MKPKRENWQKILIIVVPIAAFFALIFVLAETIDFIAENNKESAKQKEEEKQEKKLRDFKTDACVMSHVYLSRMLKSPKTAKYPACDYSDVIQIDEDTWTVTSYVDSQNGFGAMIRKNYWMQLEYYAGDWKYVDSGLWD